MTGGEHLGFGQSKTWSLSIPNNQALIGYSLFARGFTWGLGTFPTNIPLANAATLVIDANQWTPRRRCRAASLPHSPWTPTMPRTAGLFVACAMGADFADSNRRFARLLQ